MATCTGAMLEALQAQADWARERGIPLHLDGARLWECTRTLLEQARQG